jgi:acyl carrier protein
MPTEPAFIQELILSIHRRNGGQLQAVNLDLRLLDPSLQIDSLDLAEIMAAIERQFGKSPFDAPEPPRTWRDILLFLNGQ